MLKDILSEAFIETEVRVDSWRDAVRSCGKLLVAKDKIKPAYVDSMIATVEKLGPYMILLPEIALFHGEPGDKVNEPCLSLVTFAHDVEFSEFKDIHIKAAFAFAAVDKDSHMDMLQKLAMLLQNQEFITLLKTHGSKEAILEKIQNY